MKYDILVNTRQKVLDEIADAGDLNCFITPDDEPIGSVIETGFNVFHISTNVGSGQKPVARGFEIGVAVYTKMGIDAFDDYQIVNATNGIYAYLEQIRAALKDFAFGYIENYSALNMSGLSNVRRKPIASDSFVLTATIRFNGEYYEL